MDRAEKKAALNKQINEATREIKERANDYKSKGKDALIIGGIIVAGYAISKLLSSSEKSELPAPPEASVEEKPSVLGAALKGAATSIVLSVVQKKLMDYISSEKESND